jgi:hypothetical protein
MLSIVKRVLVEYKSLVVRINDNFHAIEVLKDTFDTTTNHGFLKGSS